MNDFPAELLEKIFIASVDRGGPRTRAPLSANLSQVNSRWRAVTLSSACSTLWSSDLPYRSLNWTKLCLSRCPSSPLDINIIYDETTRYDDDYRDAVRLVLTRVDQACTLRFHVSHEMTMVTELNSIIQDLLIFFTSPTAAPRYLR